MRNLRPAGFPHVREKDRPTPRILIAVHGAQGSQRAAEFVDRSFTGMDVATTADNVARNPVGAPPPVPFGQAFP